MKNLDLSPKNKKVKKTAPVLPETKSPPTRKGFRTGAKVVFGLVLLALLAAATLALYILPRATIQIQPRTEAVTRDLDIEVNENLDEVDAQGLAIPGQVIEKEIVAGQSFEATGSRNIGRQASGFVYIYNFSKNNLILKKDTTVLTVNGRNYFFTQDAGNIRPTAFIGLEDQEIDPTSLAPPVPVVAEGPGTAYNLGAGTRLEISNEVFGAQPEILYAIVAEDVSGGTDEIVRIVTENDIVGALESVRGVLLSDARRELSLENNQLKILDDGVAMEILEQSTSVQVGAQVNDFEAAVRGQFRALVYNESDVLTVMLDRIGRILPKNKVLRSGDEKNLRSRFVSLNLEQGQGILANHFEGRTSYEIDHEEFVNKVKGKSLDEIREILLSRPEIEKAEIRFYPFWVKKAPRFGNKINFEIVDAGS